jgi:simple sugar transport system permease protein
MLMIRMTFTALLAVIMRAVFAFGLVLLNFTRFGADVIALGSRRTTAALMGVRAGPTTIRIDMLSSVLAGLSGVVFSFYTFAGYSLSATGVELDTIAAVVIGGTLLSGSPSSASARSRGTSTSRPSPG